MRGVPTAGMTTMFIYTPSIRVVNAFHRREGMQLAVREHSRTATVASAGVSTR